MNHVGQYELGQLRMAVERDAPIEEVRRCLQSVVWSLGGSKDVSQMPIEAAHFYITILLATTP